MYFDNNGVLYASTRLPSWLYHDSSSPAFALAPTPASAARSLPHTRTRRHNLHTWKVDAQNRPKSASSHPSLPDFLMGLQIRAWKRQVGSNCQRFGDWRASRRVYLPHAWPCYRPATQAARQAARFLIDTDRAVRREICMDSGCRGQARPGSRGGRNGS